MTHVLVDSVVDDGSPTGLSLTVNLTSGKLYTLWIEQSNGSGISSCVADNETPVQVDQLGFAGNSLLTVYRFEASADRTSETITVTFTSTETGGSMHLIETDGHEPGANGANAIGVTDTVPGAPTGTSGQLVFDPAITAGNEALTVFLYQRDEPADAGGDSLEISNTHHRFPHRGIIVVQDDDSTADAAWTTSVVYGALGVEIVTASGGGGTPQHLSATVSRSVQVSAALRVRKPLSASSSRAVSFTAALSSPKSLAASFAVSRIAQATLRVRKPLSASFSRAVTMTARLRVGLETAVRKARMLLGVGR